MFWRLAPSLLMLAAAIFTAPAAFAQTRPLAPGVLTVVPISPEYEETVSGPMKMVEVVTGLPELDWKPEYTAKSRTVYERSKLAVLRREIWNLEFAFKPVRMISIDVPQPSGKMQRKLIWYMVYRVRYLGGDLKPEAVKDAWEHETFQTVPVSYEGRYFFPQFLLESHDFSKAYLDRVIPAAKKPIQDREMKGQPLLNSVEISSKPIPLSTEEDPQEMWGYVTWEDVDPYIDFFSVYVKGLTNAYKPADVPGVFKQGDAPGAGRDLLSKTLQLNFWRPGDSVSQHEGEISFGVPYSADSTRQDQIIRSFGLKARLDYQWLYR